VYELTGLDWQPVLRREGANYTLHKHKDRERERERDEQTDRQTDRLMVAQRLGRRTFDHGIGGSTPGRGVIKSPSQLSLLSLRGR